jgi:hypothetical protein
LSGTEPAFSRIAGTITGQYHASKLEERIREPKRGAVSEFLNQRESTGFTPTERTHSVFVSVRAIVSATGLSQPATTVENHAGLGRRRIFHTLVILDSCMAKDKVKGFMPLRFQPGYIVFGLIVSAFASFCLGQNSPPSPAPAQPHEASLKAVSEPTSEHASEHGTASAGGQSSAPSSPGSLNGIVADQSGAVIAGAHVSLTRSDEGQTPDAAGNAQSSNHESLNQESVSDISGQFFFPSVPPGSFQLTITSAGFETQTFSGVLHPGEIQVVPQFALIVATRVTNVEVALSQPEVAEEQLKVEEQQRVLGVLPNFYVSYIPDAAALTAKQKFRLAARTVVDPFTLVIVGGTAGVEQAQNHFWQYGQGAQGYAKRFGAGYADTVSGTFIGGAILPALLKQDPRYFYKGTGRALTRFLYATANAVICKGDNKRWQANYSNILGNFAAGGISNLYYPSQDRNGAGLTLANGAIGIASNAAANVFQEFFIRKLTPKAPKDIPPTPKSPSGF